MTRLLCICAIAGALGIAACGSTDQGGTAAPPVQPTAPARTDFPSAKGRGLGQLLQGMQEGPIFAPSVGHLDPGTDRVGFALFDRARKEVDVQAVALYTSKPDGTRLRGPFVAHRETLQVKPAFRSAQAAADLAIGDTFYVANVPFRSKGSALISAVARLDGRDVSAGRFGFVIGAPGGPPKVGQKAIKVHTLTDADVGGDLAKLSTRVPPVADLYTSDLANVIGKKPIVLQFSTPALCMSRTCGPVEDIALQARAETGKGVTFIQQEIYKNNDPNQGFRPQLAAWHIDSEPWTFVIDRHGRISSRFEGVLSVGELERAVAKVQ